MQGDGEHPRWQDAAAYAPLLVADRSLIAWEWLRRDPLYRLAADRARAEPGPQPDAGEAGAAARWGLHAFVPPDLPVPLARPVWRAALHPAVLPAVGRSAQGERDALPLERLASLITVAIDGDGEHLLLSDGLRCIRLDLPAWTLEGRAVELHYLIAGLAAAERPLLTLRRLLALCRSGRFSPGLHVPEARARRWVLMLRAYDAERAGAGQREIAQTLLSFAAAQPRWRTEAPSLRSQAQRLARSARAMAASGYLALLR